MRQSIFSNGSLVASPGSGHAVQVATAPDPIGLPTIPGGDLPFYMWTDACTPGVQHVTFDRRVFFPGPPTDRLFVRAFARTVSGWPWSIKSIQLFVNGHLFDGSRSANGFDYANVNTSDRRLAFFHYGLNELQLEVTKNAQPASLHPCRGSHSKRIGVLFALAGGSFPTDLTVNGSEAVKYYRVTPGTVYPVSWQWTVSNNGPAATLFGGSDAANLSGGTDLTVDPGGMEISTQDYPDWSNSGFPFLVTATRPFDARTCTLTILDVGCPGNGWLAPRASATLIARWFERVPTDQPDDNLAVTRLRWAVLQGGPSPDETNTDNDVGNATIYWCWPAAMSGGCATATPPS